ncbi:energy transducer TonB [Ferrimonas balearica]|uniref:energy transducer TonB n=1 Tax=Ferrimonas balearica TaxID=44012 RepID=UPI001C579EFF|nr:energy transducer TonB [Ferrimonas balearica]MBW3140009.1 energy transducer TonB [Ferrimonas balearica]
MDRRLSLTAALLVVLNGCSATPESASAVNAQPLPDLLTQAPWNQLNRSVPVYPREAAMAGRVGCATVAYTLTPDYQVEAIKVVSQTHRDFGRSAKRTVRSWDWSSLPAGELDAPVRVQTRFDYCFEKGKEGQRCDAIMSEFQCPGNDRLESIGYRLPAS